MKNQEGFFKQKLLKIYCFFASNEILIKICTPVFLSNILWQKAKMISHDSSMIPVYIPVRFILHMRKSANFRKVQQV
jgi:hypothetical protein